MDWWRCCHRKKRDQQMNKHEAQGQTPIELKPGEYRRQYSTFYVGSQLFGIDVLKVQEVMKAMPMSPVPLAPDFVKGLINLRGQIATAISLGSLFTSMDLKSEEPMNVVCSVQGVLLSFLVDQIGDVIEVTDQSFESAPDTMPRAVSRFMNGVHKLQDEILCVIDSEKIINAINE
jgi:purine-binding chemotaxis protein CheW